MQLHKLSNNTTIIAAQIVKTSMGTNERGFYEFICGDKEYGCGLSLEEPEANEVYNAH